MKAVAFAGPGREVRDLPDPDPAAGEAVVDVAYCGVCGSDLHEYASSPVFRALAMSQARLAW